MFTRVFAHIRRQPVAFVALFFALGGGAIAANKYIRTTDPITAGDLGAPGSTYGDPLIAKGAVTNDKLANPSLTITPGTGLTGGGLIALGGSGTLKVDPTLVQNRVSGTCALGSAIASINQDGSVACQSTNVTGFSHTENVSSGASFSDQTSVTINAPASGEVLVDGGAGAETESASCNPCALHVRIEADGSSDSAPVFATVGNGTTNPTAAIASQRWVFPVTAGSHTYELQTGVFPTGAGIKVINPDIAAVYLPG